MELARAANFEVRTAYREQDMSGCDNADWTHMSVKQENRPEEYSR